MATASEKKSLKRRSILDAATRLFTDKSVADTAIDEVVQMAGVAKGTFYLYFRDKYDLLDQIVMQRTAEIFTEGCDFIHAGDISPVDVFIHLADNIADYMQKNKKVTALIDRRFSACFKQAIFDEQDAFRKEVNYLTDLLTFGETSRSEAKRQLYILMDMIGSVCCSAVLDGEPYTLEEIKPTLHNFICKFFAGGDAR